MANAWAFIFGGFQSFSFSSFLSSLSSNDIFQKDHKNIQFSEKLLVDTYLPALRYGTGSIFPIIDNRFLNAYLHQLFFYT